MKYIITAIVIDLFMLALFVYRDSEKIKRGKRIVHWKSALFRSMIFLLNSWVLYMNEYQSGLHDVRMFIWFSVCQAVVYWIVFDIALNKKRGKKWNYMPPLRYGISFTDMFPSWTWQYVIKIISIMILIATI